MQTINALPVPVEDRANALIKCVDTLFELMGASVVMPARIRPSSAAAGEFSRQNAT